MKFLVCLKQVPDSTVRVKVAADGKSIATTSARGAPGVTPSAARSFSGISFFFAFMIPGRLG